ncbi:hypothetical protein AAC387_Pa12g1048 [Persea americana]
MPRGSLGNHLFSRGSAFQSLSWSIRLKIAIGISVLVLIHVCIVGRAFKRSLMAANRGERSSDSSIGMSANDLENFKMVDKCRLLPNCNHSFHAHCIDSWLLKTPFCFLCLNDESL